MKLATFKTSHGASYGAVTDSGVIDLGKRLGSKYADLKALIAGNAFSQVTPLLKEKADYKLSDITWLPVIQNPERILCVGLNYQDHVVETGRDNTEQPAIFIRLPESQVGHKQPILRPREGRDRRCRHAAAPLRGQRPPLADQVIAIFLGHADITHQHIGLKRFEHG